MGYLAEIGYIAAVCAAAHLLHRCLHVPGHITRKLIHILIGFVFFIQYHFFREDVAGLLIVPAAVTLGLFLVARLRLLPSMVNPDNPYGIFYYALSILLSNVVAILYPPYHAAAGAAILCLAFGDGAAALLASLLPRRHRLIGEKSVEGSLFCLLFSYLGMWLVTLAFPSLSLPPLLLPFLALLTVLLELFTGRYDNPAIVLGVGVAALLLQTAEEALLLRLLIGLVVGIGILFLSVWRRMLTLPAALTALGMLLLILALGGWIPAAYILLLYTLCALLHAIGRRHNARHTEGARRLRQVAANGLVGALSLLLYGTVGGVPFLIAYYAAICEFVADTAASDIGTLIPRDPVDICRLRRVPRGRSGGVSAVGTLAALLTSLLGGALSLLGGLTLTEGITVAAAAFLGVLFDSVLGSLFQGKYRCSVCGKETESAYHCNTPAIRTEGFARLDNTRVNLLSTLFSAIVAALAAWLLL